MGILREINKVRIVIALGGNALLKRGEALTIDAQKENAKRACKLIAEVARSHQVTLTHGNGPQVGMLALQAASHDASKPYPFDVLDAESEGMIGYQLSQQLRNFLSEKKIATLLTQIEVDPNDSAFLHPTKFIGPGYDKIQAEALAHTHQWTIKADGQYFRRVIASPQPLRILELEIIKLLLDAGVLVICCGGGGIPVIREATGDYEGVEAVIDKDLASSLLAREIKADCFVILTDVMGVMKNWGDSFAEVIKEIAVSDLEAMHFPEGSMLPKIKAACEFVKKTGHRAYIGALDDLPEILAGNAGTVIDLTI
jgi:carbamate kinase